MQNRQIQLNELLEKLYQAEKMLDQLEASAYAISENYNSNAFPEQTELAENQLENLIIAATHETASQIGFYRNNIETLANFISFREKYAIINDEELAKILDENLPIENKKNISKRFDSVQNMQKQLEQLQQDWNQTFQNKSYVKVKKQLRI